MAKKVVAIDAAINSLVRITYGLMHRAVMGVTTGKSKIKKQGKNMGGKVDATSSLVLMGRMVSSLDGFFIILGSMDSSGIANSFGELVAIDSTTAARKRQSYDYCKNFTVDWVLTDWPKNMTGRRHRQQGVPAAAPEVAGLAGPAGAAAGGVGRSCVVAASSGAERCCRGVAGGSCVGVVREAAVVDSAGGAARGRVGRGGAGPAAGGVGRSCVVAAPSGAERCCRGAAGGSCMGAVQEAAAVDSAGGATRGRCDGRPPVELQRSEGDVAANWAANVALAGLRGETVRVADPRGRWRQLQGMSEGDLSRWQEAPTARCVGGGAGGGRVGRADRGGVGPAAGSVGRSCAVAALSGAE
ncbi:uncharacterized protein LOC131875955 [Cryptomeria japonica]|uniref:uncharacterized protein LOC131875955 n=1 Tax=Cryptomeria japonica TaxID=3369 RepID=UPI0027DA1611|nr:uncharacterized protein LOC131875955 [Cryptomeria japonica]